jgi:opacity protein-like surface antigen
VQLRTIALAAAVLFLPSLSLGAPAPYVSGFLGYTGASDSDAGVLEDLELRNFVSFAAAGGVEYPASYARLRFEAELSYRQNELRNAEFLGQKVGLDGHVSALAVLLNAYYGVPLKLGFEPYVLAGAGGALTSFRDAKVRGVKAVDDDQVQWAYQLGAGLGFDLTPRFTVDLQYRYFATSRDRFEDEAEDGFLFRYRTYTVGAGVRWRF